MEHQHEMAKILQELADQPLKDKSHTTHQAKLVALLRFFSESGRTLKFCCGPQALKRHPSTLKKYCRENLIKFPDYIPRCMKDETRTEEKAAD